MHPHITHVCVCMRSSTHTVKMLDFILNTFHRLQGSSLVAYDLVIPIVLGQVCLKTTHQGESPRLVFIILLFLFQTLDLTQS